MNVSEYYYPPHPRFADDCAILVFLAQGTKVCYQVVYILNVSACQVRLPYIGDVSYRFEGKICKAIDRCHSTMDSRVIFESHRRLKSEENEEARRRGGYFLTPKIRGFAFFVRGRSLKKFQNKPRGARKIE